MSQSLFGEQRVAERTPVIELNSAYGVSNVRDVISVSNSGTVTAASTGEILLSTGATASSTARLDSAERIRYIPGFDAEIGIGIRIPTLPTGNQEAKWGVRNPDQTEGIYFGVDATGFYVATLRNSVETKIYDTLFNINKLDGAEGEEIDRRFDIDLSEGNIFQVDYSWYGYGQIVWEVTGIPTGRNKQVPIRCHQAKIDGTTSVQSPNLPIFIEATNGGDAADFDVYVGGRQASVVGRYVPKYRTTAQARASVSTTTTSLPLVSFRNKSGFEDRTIQIDDALAIVASQDHVIEFYINPTLTDASWTTPTNATASETALETDVSATALSGGTLVFSYYAAAGLGAQERPVESLAVFDIPENQIVTMAARTVTGTGTCKGFFRIREEW